MNKGQIRSIIKALYPDYGGKTEFCNRYSIPISTVDDWYQNGVKSATSKAFIRATVDLKALDSEAPVGSCWDYLSAAGVFEHYRDGCSIDDLKSIQAGDPVSKHIGGYIWYHQPEDNYIYEAVKSPITGWRSISKVKLLDLHRNHATVYTHPTGARKP